MMTRAARLLRFKYLSYKRELRYWMINLKNKNGFQIKNIEGSQMRLDLKDRGLPKDLILDGIREPESTEMIKKILNEGSTVIDIGANIGYYALMESRLVGNKGAVYAIEPSPRNFNCLKSNIELNGYRNIKAYQIAIGDRIGKAKMNISPHSNLNSLVDQKNKKIIGRIDVDITSLDYFLKKKKNPDFIRMDVEGYECNIIRGMKNILKKKRPLKLFIELHPHIMYKEQTINVLKTLMENGFETRKVTRSVTVSEMKVMLRKQYDFSYKSIKELLNDENFISGKMGAFEMFFERK